MSSLPQRKKTAEEIARLRETFGVASTATAPPPLEVKSPAPAEARQQEIQPKPAGPAAPLFQKMIQPGTTAPSRPLLSPFQAAPSAPPEPVTKRVHSLKKSEQGPIHRKTTNHSSSSPIPARRHSNEEIEAFRKREALARLETPPPDPRRLPAHPLLIVPGYLLALGTGAYFFVSEYPLTATASCAAGSLIASALLLILRPLSRHHSAFIATITLILLAFGTLHYFPQLKHAP